MDDARGLTCDPGLEECLRVVDLVTEVNLLSSGEEVVKSVLGFRAKEVDVVHEGHVHGHTCQ